MAKYTQLTSANFDETVLKATQPVLVDFWAEWCGPCKAIGPTIEELAGDFDGRATIGKVNVDEEPELAQRYGIRAIPALVFFVNGEIVEHIPGVVPKDALASKLESLATPTA